MTNTKAYKGIGMEGIIAKWYAYITLKDINRHKLMAQQLAEKIPPTSRVLEIAPGPGYFCIELARLGDYEISGLDISKSFVEISRKNAAAAGLPLNFRLGNASDMPFADGSFDVTFCQAAFKNFSQPVKAICEMYRVLRPNGMAMIVDLRSDASSAEIEHEVKGMGLSHLNETFTRWTFEHSLLKRAYSIEDMRRMIAQTPFGQGQIEVSGVGFQICLEKNHKQ